MAFFSSLHKLKYNPSIININFLQNRSLARLNEPLQAEMLKHKLRKLFANEYFSRLMIVE